MMGSDRWELRLGEGVADRVLLQWDKGRRCWQAEIKHEGTMDKTRDVRV